jgi:hypothetical protein
LRKKDRDDLSVGPVFCADIDVNGCWKSDKKPPEGSTGRLEVPAGRKDPPDSEKKLLKTPAGRKDPPDSEKKLLRTPAGRKDPPGGEQGDGQGKRS